MDGGQPYIPALIGAETVYLFIAFMLVVAFAIDNRFLCLYGKKFAHPVSACVHITVRNDSTV